MGVYFFRKFKKEKGFTLVELLIIVIVVAVLMGISIQTFTLLQNRARETTTEVEMSNITKALQIYVTLLSNYPEESDFPEALEAAGIMKNVPEFDIWKNPYHYSSVAGVTYTLESYGINQVDGGGDDIVYMNGILIEDGAYPND
jgi:general secretion pathway protein G